MENVTGIPGTHKGGHEHPNFPGRQEQSLLLWQVDLTAGVSKTYIKPGIDQDPPVTPLLLLGGVKL